MTVRVLLADDQDMVRTGFRLILSREPDIEVIADAANGRDAVAATRRHRPDVVLMDIRMPILDGLAATRDIAGVPDCPSRVIVLTTFDDDHYIYDALAAGASGFLLKDAPADQLINAIHTVAGGAAILAPAVTRRLIEQFTRRRPETREQTLVDRLTERERDVLRLIATGQSNPEIAATLVLGEATVKTHVARILAKLEARDRVQAVIISYRSGLAYE